MLNKKNFVSRVTVALLIATVFVVGLLLMWYMVSIIFIIFGGVLLAILLRGLSVWLSGKTHLAANWSLALIGVIIVLVIGLSGWYLTPKIGSQLTQLSETLPEAFKRVEQQREQLVTATDMAFEDLERNVNQAMTDLEQAYEQAIQNFDTVS